MTANKVFCGDAAEVLKSLPQGSANMCVTSPPYYGLRDYGIENQIGTEQTPQEYVDRLARVFDEVYRVLMDDGTLWLNIGDSYAGSGKGPMSIQVAGNGKNRNLYDMKSRIYEVPKKWNGIKPKDLIGIPWMLAFALRERGWYLRSDIICDMNTQAITAEKRKMRRCKDVWEVSTNSYRMDEHFAMFPERLIDPCILAGSKEGGVVLDPFFGSGTTGAAAKRLGRSCIGIDINPRYIEKAEERIARVIPEKPQENRSDSDSKTTAGGGTK